MKTSGLAILCAAFALLLAQPALAATTHYVSPAGSGTTCTDALPCSLASAVTGLVSGDTIQLASGVYDLGTGSFSTPIGVSLVGAPGPRPTITSNSIAAALQVIGGNARHLAITQTNPVGLALGSSGSNIEDVVVSSAGSGVSLASNDVLRNSIIQLTGTSGSGIQAGTSIGSTDVRNVLVSAPGAGTIGVQAMGNCLMMGIIDPLSGTMMCLPLSQPTVNVRNSIIRAATDLVTSGLMGYNGAINVAYSDYRAAKAIASPAGTIVDQGGNIEGDPAFKDAAAGDFHSLAGSPTIDAGDPLAASDSKVGPLDADGLTRILGSAIDMGPFEFVPAQSGATDTGGNGGGTGSQPGGGTGAQPAENTPAPTPPAAPAVVDKTAPVLKSLRFAPGLLRKSSLVSYLVNEQSTTTLRVLRKTTGVKKGRTCAAAPRKLTKGAKRCTRYVVVSGGLTRADRPGKSSFRFDGKLRGKRLTAGSYRLVAVAVDGAGNQSKPVTVAFRVR